MNQAEMNAMKRPFEHRSAKRERNLSIKAVTSFLIYSDRANYINYSTEATEQKGGLTFV